MSGDPALAAARTAAAVLGVADAGAVVVRRAATVQVRLPAAGAVARVHALGARPVAEREAQVAAVLAAAGVPAVRLVPGRQPVDTPGGPVTVWAWLEATGERADAPALATVARELHERTAVWARAAAGAPALDPFAAAAAQLASPAAVAATDAADRTMLAALVDQLAADWPELVAGDPLGSAVVHGDLHHHNVVITAAGPVLVDLELAGVGPPSYDLAAIAVAGNRYGVPAAEVDAAFAAYGADPRRWPGFRRLCEVYELWVTAWAVGQRAASPAAEAEAERRLERWRTGSSPPWTLG